MVIVVRGWGRYVCHASCVEDCVQRKQERGKEGRRKRERESGGDRERESRRDINIV